MTAPTKAVPAENGWELTEVKSGLDPKPELIDDLAYTYLVATRSELAVKPAILAFVHAVRVVATPLRPRSPDIAVPPAPARHGHPTDLAFC
jgi:hypothetical protein